MKTSDKTSSTSTTVVLSERAAKAEAYGKPRDVWVEDGHVFVESYDGNVVRMVPEVAIELGRIISDAGADSLMNKVMDRIDDAEIDPKL